MKAIVTDKAAPPGGHYAQGIVHEGQIYVSGQLPVRPDGTHRTTDNFDDQCRQVLTNVLRIVEAGGGEREGVVKATAYIVGIDNWPAFNKIFAEVFGDHKPARAIVPVPELHHGYLVEVEVLATVRGS